MPILKASRIFSTFKSTIHNPLLWPHGDQGTFRGHALLHSVWVFVWMVLLCFATICCLDLLARKLIACANTSDTVSVMLQLQFGLFPARSTNFKATGCNYCVSKCNPLEDKI
eukprot:4414631-Amphidinium_carterae.1